MYRLLYFVVTLSATALSGGTISSGSIVKFPNIKHHIGVNNTAVNNFILSGKFVCDRSGLYIIAANILSKKEGSWYKLVKNNTELTRAYIAFHGGKAEGWHSSTALTYAMLTHGDTISVVAGSRLNISGSETTLTIVKIK